MIKQRKSGIALMVLFVGIVASSTLAVNDAEAANEPLVKIAGLVDETEGVYEVRFHIFAGDEVLPAGTLLVSSDASSKETGFSSVRANSVTSTSVKISADDPNTIGAQIILTPTYSIGESIVQDTEDGDPYVKRNSIVDQTEGLYEVRFQVHAGDEDLPESILLVSSDMMSKEVVFGSVPANSFTGTFTRISAEDPNSIVAEIIGSVEHEQSPGFEIGS